MRALLVDDEEPARERLRALLAQFDDVTVVGEARDGHEALEKIGDTQPDLVFLDIEMPGMTGMELAAALPPPRPRILFCTAYDQYAIEAFEQHATDYLLKPVSRKRLAAAIDRVRQDLGSRKLQQDDLDEATRTQARLLPRELPPLVGLEFAGRCRPALGVGGDYYDFLRLGERRLGLAVGDVSGKGLFAGLLVSSLQARIQALAPGAGDDLVGLIAETNRGLLGSLDTHRYATFFFGMIDTQRKRLTYVNAGHNPPLVLRRDGSVERLPASGPVLGVLPDATYCQVDTPFDTGDRLVAFSDGLTEALDAGGQEYGEERLCRTLASGAGAGADGAPEATIQAVLADLDGFVGSTPQHDDLTLIVARGT